MEFVQTMSANKLLNRYISGIYVYVCIYFYVYAVIIFWRQHWLMEGDHCHKLEREDSSL